jgi:hypothetical protein
MHHLTGLVEPSTLGASYLYDLRTMEVKREAVVPEPSPPGLRRDPEDNRNDSSSVHRRPW